MLVGFELGQTLKEPVFCFGTFRLSVLLRVVCAKHATSKTAPVGQVAFRLLLVGGDALGLVAGNAVKTPSCRIASLPLPWKFL